LKISHQFQINFGGKRKTENNGEEYTDGFFFAEAFAKSCEVPSLYQLFWVVFITEDTHTR
jgi:hypothetical protein